MKSNARVLLLVLAVLTILGWYQVLDGEEKEGDKSYKQAVENAEHYTSEGAYEKALDSYAEAIAYQDTLEIRRIMNNLYLLCLEDERIRYDESKYQTFLEAMLRAYPEREEAYEMAVKYWYEQSGYLKCQTILQQAEKNGVFSESLEEYMRLIKYECKLTSTRYSDFRPLYQGIMAVCTTDVWNYVDGEGSVILTGNYEEAQPFSGDTAIVKKRGTCRIISKDGTVQKMLSDNIISSTGGYGDGLAPVQTESGYIYIDGEGNQKLGPFDKASVFCNGIAAVKSGEQWQVIDSSGKIIYDGAGDIVLDGMGRCAVQEVFFAAVDGSYALYSMDGIKIKNESYESVDAFNADGIAAVKKDGLWGYIDKEGNWVLEPQYEEAKSFSNGLAGISKEGLWGFIDMSGEVVMPCIYENVDYWNEKNCCMVLTGGFWQLLKRICA